MTDGNDSIRAGSEECDDGNTHSGDGCELNTVSHGWHCTEDGSGLSNCETRCGDGLVGGIEECDDSNTEGSDGCDDSCVVEAGWDCSSGTCHEIHGDGL